MVKIERHGAINIADKPCPNPAESVGRCWNIQGSCTDGRESQLKPYNTSVFSHTHSNNLPSVYRPELASHVDGNVYHSPDTSCIYSKSTISLSLAVNLDSSLSRPHLQTQDALPYLELPIEKRDTYPYLATVSNSRPQSQFHSKGSIFGNRNLKLTTICLFLSLLLLCNSCVCSICSESTQFPMNISVRPDFMTYIDEVNLIGIAGQCLTVTGSFVDDICRTPSSKPIKDTSSIRMDRLSQSYTNFCGLPLSQIMSNVDIQSAVCGSFNSCVSVLSEVAAVDEELSDMFCQFEDVLGRINCEDTFSTLGNCSRCKESYKQWLCSVYHTYFHEGVPLRPCIDTCDRVSESCPFFRPHGETLIGEPGFLCKDSKSSLAEDTAVVYGPAGCCYSPCHLLPSNASSCPQLNVTSNCTSLTSGTPRLVHARTDSPLVLFSCILLSSVLLHWFPLFNIGLT